MKKLKQFIIKNKQVKGFTLVEMVIVIAIIAMLILLIVPGLSKQKDRATSKTDEALRTTIETQRQLAEDNGDGTSLEELVKKFEKDIKKETLTENILFNAKRDTYTEVSINGGKLMLDVEVVK